MKKIGLLTTLLVCGLLLTGCNYHQYEEEYSEYGLLQWPNGTITLDNFKKEGNIINESELEFGIEKFCGESPETACVPVILKENEILVTPHEYNEFIAEETDLQLLDYRYYTDLKTFRKVTGLKEASPEYVQGELPGTYVFDAYTKFYQTREERGAKIQSKVKNQHKIGKATCEILEWTGYIGCPGGCEDGSDEEYMEGYLYQYTNPELGIRITTPINYRHSKDIFHVKYDGPLFEQYENGIYSIENKEWEGWTYDNTESIKMFEKDPSQSLEQLLRENLLKDGCVLEIDNESLSYDEYIVGAKNNTFYWMNEDLKIYDVPEPWKVKGNDCRHDKLGRTGIYVESEDGKRYYLVNKGDGCAPGPCSIFGKIEIL